MVGNAHRPPCQNTVVFHIFNCILYDVIEYKAVAPALHIWFADSDADSAMLSFPYRKGFFYVVLPGNAVVCFITGLLDFCEILLAPFSADIYFFFVLTNAVCGIVDLT